MARARPRPMLSQSRPIDLWSSLRADRRRDRFTNASATSEIGKSATTTKRRCRIIDRPGTGRPAPPIHDNRGAAEPLLALRRFPDPCLRLTRSALARPLRAARRCAGETGATARRVPASTAACYARLVRWCARSRVRRSSASISILLMSAAFGVCCLHSHVRSVEDLLHLEGRRRVPMWKSWTTTEGDDKRGSRKQFGGLAFQIVRRP